MAPELTSNGTTFWQAIPAMQIWSESEAPKTLVTDGIPMMEMAGPASFVLDLLAKDARKAILEQFEKVEYAGQSGENHLIEFITAASGGMPSMPVTLTIGPKTAPWVHRLSVKFPAEQAAPGMPNEMALDFTKWAIIDRSDASRAKFAFTPESDWKKVDNLMETLMADMGGGPPMGDDHNGSHPTVGKPAPDFTLTSIDGKSVSLQDLRGKIVILDFWATWCGPCRKGLPVLMEIAKSRANDGVVLWAVDLDEPKEKVAEFLKKKGWDLPVLLDSKGKVSQKYGVGGIPHTVVIDPKGVVHSVEIGFGGKEATMKKLNAEIDAIKGGQSTP